VVSRIRAWQRPRANRIHAISPDSRWLAYQSDQSGRAEIYVRPYPDIDAGQWPISINGGHSPVWAHDGREIFYMNGPNLMTAAVRVDGTKFIAGTPAVLFSGPFDTIQDNNYDVSPDGSHFIMVEARPIPRCALSRWSSTGLWSSSDW
jgi:hypothetical protein